MAVVAGVAVVSLVTFSPVGSAATTAPGNRNGTLHYGVDFSSLSGSLDPAASTSDCDSIALQPIYDTLVHLVNGAPQPGLAQSWSLQGRTFTLNLRPGLKFQDGEPFDAQAVKMGLLHNQAGEQTNYALSIISSIDVVNATTLRLNLNTDSGATLPYTLTGREGMIVAPNDLKNANQKPVGAGPYEFVQYTPGGSLTVKRYPGYYDQAAAPFGTVDYVQASTGGPGVTALLAGDIDLFEPDANQYSALKGRPNIGVNISPTLSYLQLQFNTTRPPLNNVKVRQAINYAVNRQQINTVALGGQGIIAWMPWPKGSAYYNASVAQRYPYNPAKARELLKQAGYPHGFNFLMVVPNGAGFVSQEGQLLQQQLDAVGIKTTISMRDSTDIVPTFYQAGSGDGFAALRVGDPSPTGDIYEQWGQGQEVAKYVVPGGGRADITHLMLDAQSTANPTQVISDVRQSEAIIVNNALDAEMAFLPQLTAWDTTKLAGTPTAPENPCLPIPFTGLSLKK